MFVSALSSPTIDRIDPYWYCRLSGLKVAYVAIILFLINGFLKSPQFPVMSMLVAEACVVLTEMPSINSRKKKDLLFISFFILVVLTMNIFGLVSYFRLGLLLGVGSWMYVLYSLLAKTPQVASIVGTLTLIGLVSIQGQPPTDLYSIVNQDLFFLQYASAAFVACKLFPNLYDRILLSAVLRMLERDIHHLREGSPPRAFRRAILMDLTVIANVRELHRTCYEPFVESVRNLQIRLFASCVSNDEGTSELLEELKHLHASIAAQKQCGVSQGLLERASDQNSNFSTALVQTATSWNELCKAVY